jgi:adenine-specific DNA-methyltransferase
MQLKKAILAQLGRDELKRIVDELELDCSDRRSAEGLRSAVSQSRRASPEVLLESLNESQVKAVCDAVGTEPRGRRKELIARLLSGAGAADAASPGDLPATNQEARSQNVAKSTSKLASDGADSYSHPESTSLLRPDVGTQPQFKKRKPPKTYRYDSSLSPSLEWDGQNPAREEGERMIARIAQCGLRIAELAAQAPDEARDAEIKSLQSEIRNLQSAIERLARPFLNWAGKAERVSFDVPTLPLFVHERLSTKGIIDTLIGHRRRKETQKSLFDLFGDPERPIIDQVLGAYEYQDQWTNRMILGDSLVVMNSLVQYENLAGRCR